MLNKSIYQHKIVSAEEAASHIGSNMTVVLGHAASTPTKVLEVMTQNKDNYQNVEIIHMLCLGKGDYLAEEMLGHFRHNAIFVGGNSRRAVKENRADYTPCFFNEVPSLFREGHLSVDCALIQVSEPNEEGYCSFGLSTDYTKSAAECALITIAEMNSQMPVVYGDNFIHVDDIDYIVKADYPLHQLQPPAIGEIERSIGENCAKLIEDGSTLQLGIGAIPDAVLMFLKDKKDLGIHTEMFSDGILDLVEKGVINNSKKTLHPGKMISTFLMGTQKLYDFVHENPMVELYPVDYVNNPAIIMQNDQLVSINSCIQVDLMGQVASESIGLHQFSGVGGQVDYVRGASMSKGGKSIIAIPSTASKGTVSRIVPLLTEGSAVTTSRNDVHYIVTEYGVANLKGRTLKQRAKLLIDIAHPKFRPTLRQAYQDRFGQED